MGPFYLLSQVIYTGPQWVTQLIKRGIDIIFALIGIIFLLPIMIVVGILIKIDSKGPIFYRGLRTGLNGKLFKIYKFRTMVVNAEEIGGGTTALNDPRITKLGNIIRKYKIDELPQLINIIKGEMSLVGPRPELYEYTSRYQGDEKLILTILPGLSDFSSIVYSSLDEHVGPYNADRIFEEKILPRKNQLRIEYVKEQNLRHDLVIICKTIHIILSKINNRNKEYGI